MMPGEFQGDAVKITGAQIRGYAVAAVGEEVSAARNAVQEAQHHADAAKGYMDKSAASAGNAANAAGLATSEANRAEKARRAIEDLGVSAYSVEAGSEAKVIKSVTPEGMTFHFAIPRGEQGAVGPRGAQGIQGEKGDQGPPGESGVTTPASGWFTLAGDEEGNL